jgi:hypothetical protein
MLILHGLKVKKRGADMHSKRTRKPILSRLEFPIFLFYNHVTQKRSASLEERTSALRGAVPARHREPLRPALQPSRERRTGEAGGLGAMVFGILHHINVTLFSSY